MGMKLARRYGSCKPHVPLHIMTVTLLLHHLVPLAEALNLTGVGKLGDFYHLLYHKGTPHHLYGVKKTTDKPSTYRRLIPKSTFMLSE